MRFTKKIYDRSQYTKCLALVTILLFSSATAFCDAVFSTKGTAAIDFDFKICGEDKSKSFSLTDLKGSVVAV
ncbi:MAG: hypothetical protein LBD81_00425, partial [Holosporaceae bacterium]|nr:hypothetical protein [Holosporaceae bacterium]